MKTVRRLFAIAFFAAAFYLAYKFSGGNAGEVEVDLLFTTTPPAPLWMALLAAFALGALGAALLLVFELGKLQLTARRYRKTVASLESEIHQLRNLPLAAEGSDGSEVNELDGRGSGTRPGP